MEFCEIQQELFPSLCTSVRHRLGDGHSVRAKRSPWRWFGLTNFSLWQKLWLPSHQLLPWKFGSIVKNISLQSHPFSIHKNQIRQEWQLDKYFKGETIYFVSVPNISVQVLQTFYLNCVTPVASRASGGHGRKHRNLPIFASARFSSWQYFLWADFHTSTICFGPIFLLAIFYLSRFSYRQYFLSRFSY